MVFIKKGQKMEKAILIALITACTSLLVAILSIISAAISSRNSTKSAKELEELKHKLKLEIQNLKETKRIKNEYVNALCESIKKIQIVKDVLQRIINSRKESHHSEVAIKNITEASQELVNCYEDVFTSLLVHKDSYEKNLFHRAKGLTLSTENYVKLSLENKSYASDLSHEEKEHLFELRLQLSDIQAQLQSSIYEHVLLRDSR
jgi:hypothetical protein